MVTHTSNGWGLEIAEMMFASNVKREGPWGSLDRVFVLTEVCCLWGFPTQPLPPVPWAGRWAQPKARIFTHIIFFILLWVVKVASHRYKMFTPLTLLLLVVFMTLLPAPPASPRTRSPTGPLDSPGSLGGCSECSAQPFPLRPLWGCGHTGWSSLLMGTERAPFPSGSHSLLQALLSSLHFSLLISSQPRCLPVQTGH